MPRYIDADALKQRIMNNWYTASEISDDIDAEPTADVVEVKHGKWEKTSAFPHWLCCDQCHKRIVPNAEWIKEYNIPTNYCPNCGAKMNGEETEDETANL